MPERWFYAVKDGEGSVGTVVAPDAEARGFTVQSVDVPDGKVPAIVDGRLVAADPPVQRQPETVEAMVRRIVAEELAKR